MNNKSNLSKWFLALAMTFKAAFCSASEESTSYLLKTGKQAAKRLELQSSHYAHSEIFLIKSGIKKGDVVYDIGCGNGMMSEKLSHLVGVDGHVYAIDSSEAQLSEAKKRLQGLTNVSFVQLDVNQLDQFSGKKADIIYARMLLMHLKDPKTALVHIKSHLKDTGAVVLEEIYNSSFLRNENQGYMSNYLKAALELGRRNGVDYDFGARLNHVAADCGFQVELTEESAPMVQPDDMKLYMQELLIEIKDTMIGKDIVKPEEFSKWQTEASQLNFPIYFPTIVSIKARLRQ